MNTKNTTTKPADLPNVPFGDMAERGNAQAKEAYEKATSGSLEAAELLKDCFANAVKGAQQYNSKLLEYAHANSNSAFEFFQKLAAVKSPSEFVTLSTEHSRVQFERLTEQSRDLASLARAATSAAVQPVQTVMTKAFNRAA